jgi:hypothetical protein
MLHPVWTMSLPVNLATVFPSDFFVMVNMIVALGTSLMKITKTVKVRQHLIIIYSHVLVISRAIFCPHSSGKQVIILVKVLSSSMM